MPVPAGDDHHKIVGSDPQPLNGICKAVAEDLPGQREPLRIGKGHAVIHYRHRKIAPGSKFAQGLGNMPRPQYDQPLSWGQRVDKAVGALVLIKTVFRAEKAIRLFAAAAYGAGKLGQIALLAFKAGLYADGAAVMHLQQRKIIGITDRQSIVSSFIFIIKYRFYHIIFVPNCQ